MVRSPAGAENRSGMQELAPRLALGTLLAALAFAAVPASESLAAGALGFGVMRVVFAGMVAGLIRAEELWAAPLVGFGGALVGAIALGSYYPHLAIQPLLLQAVLVVPLAWGIAIVVRRGFLRAVSAMAVVFICGGLLWQIGIIPGAPQDHMAGMRQALAVDPAPGQYRFDGEIYARTVSLMKDGHSYYPAFAQAFEEDARMSGPPPGALNYRQRWLSEIWALVPGSGRMAPWRSLAAFSLIVMVAGYAFARRYVEPAAALLAPMWLSAYFAYPLLSQWFTFSEFYGGGMAVVVLYFISRQRWFAGAIALLLAVAFRELILVLLPVYVLAWALDPRRRDEVAALMVALIAPMIVLFYHLTAAPGAPASGGSLSVWLQGSGFPRLQEALLFSTQVMALPDVLVFVWVFAALLAGLAAPAHWRKVLLLGAVAAPLLLVFTFSANEWDYYWGAIATPILLAVSPVAVVTIMPSTAARLDRRQARDSARPDMVRVVLPAYNEAASIGDLLARIDEVMKSAEQNYAVLVVDDGSSDETGAIAESYADRMPVTVVRNDPNRGLGGAILRGLKAAANASRPGDVVVTLDADLTQDPGHIPALVDRWMNGADLVIASRFRPGARVIGLSAFRRLMTFGARAGMSVVMHVEGARDYSCGFRLYDGEALRTAFSRYGDDLVSERGFACMVEILGRMRRFVRVEETAFVLHYEEKRSASTMRVGTTVLDYFRVAARVNLTELGGKPA